MPKVSPSGGWKSGVYLIRNRANGKVYVGSSCRDIARRWGVHVRQLIAGVHHSRHLQRAWYKYGAEAFDFSVLERCQPSFCIRLEQKWLDHHKAADPEFGYNVYPVAGSPLGTKASEETRAKVSAANRRRTYGPKSPEARAKMSAAAKLRPPMSAETRAKVSAAGRGRVKSAEERAKLSAALKGHVLSEETKAKIRGHKRTDEQRARMSVAQKARKYVTSDKTKEKLSVAFKGRIITEEHRQRLSAALKGRVVPEEQRERMREAAVAREERKRNKALASVPKSVAEKQP